MILVLDNTVLINCIDRCRSVDIIQKLSGYPFDIEIVKTVRDEYLAGAQICPERTNIDLFNAHMRDTITVIDDAKLPATYANLLHRLDKGELLSAVYLLELKGDRVLCTDDKATHIVLDKEFGQKCLWTSNLLVLLHKKHPSLMSEAEVYSCHDEMIRNGFIGIPTHEIDIDFSYEILDC